MDKENRPVDYVVEVSNIPETPAHDYFKVDPDVMARLIEIAPLGEGEEPLLPC